MNKQKLKRMASNNQGLCMSCKFIQDNVEPDAKKYTCRNCGEKKVYGAEEILLMGTLEDKANNNVIDIRPFRERKNNK